MAMCKNKYATLYDKRNPQQVKHTVKLRNGRLTISDGLDWNKDVLTDPLHFSLVAFDKDHDYDEYLHELKLAKEDETNYWRAWSPWV